MDDLLNFETSFAEDGDSDNDLLASDDENQPLSTGAPSANIPTMAQHQKLPSDAHNSYSSQAHILTSSPDAPPNQRFSFLPEKKQNKTRTNSLYNDAQKRQEKLEKLRQKKFEDEFAKSNFQVSKLS